jgi:hypothetical protein
LFKIKIQTRSVNLSEGVGAGFIPKTNSTLGKDRHDDYNVAGYGTSIKAGLDITFLNTFIFKEN